MKYLVDSDWLIDTMLGVSHAAEFLEQHSSEGLAVSIITMGELFEGMVDHPNADQRLAEFRELLDDYTVLGLSDPIMETFARARLALRRQGQLISDLDILIASTAIAHDLTLITRNLRHFQRIPDLKLFPTQDDV